VIGRYDTPTAFREALEARLANASQRDGVHLQRLSRRVAFERLLARLFRADDPPWLLKGGYSLELRMPGRARSTLGPGHRLQRRRMPTTKRPRCPEHGHASAHRSQSPEAREDSQDGHQGQASESLLGSGLPPQSPLRPRPIRCDCPGPLPKPLDIQAPACYNRAGEATLARRPGQQETGLVGPWPLTASSVSKRQPTSHLSFRNRSSHLHYTAQRHLAHRYIGGNQ